MRKIAIVEDEKSIAETLQLNLELEGFETLVFQDGGVAKRAMDQLISCQIILLDVMLPEVNGLTLCQLIRQQSEVPILMLSAKGMTSERIEGLKAGANDYLPKPFDLEELLLRIDNLLPDIKKESAIFKIGDVEVNFGTFQYRNTSTNATSTLTKREVELLQLFKEKEGLVISRDEILDRLWGREQFPTARTIDNYILSFRKIFEKDARNPIYFHSIRGVGYRYNAD